MTPTFLFGTFFGFVFAYLLRIVLGSIGIHSMRSRGFCTQCGRRAPAFAEYTVDLESGNRCAAVFCEPCFMYSAQVSRENPPPWSKR